MKIAVYTIALNEEKFVERWYESVKDADYLMIADTGSTDGTIELAKSLGINIVNIAIKPWRFDDARNAAMALLPTDIDYCISLDMDEVMAPNWREPLEQMTSGQVSYKYTWQWKDTEGTVPEFQYVSNKIHKRFGYRWKYPIHEVIGPDMRNKEHTDVLCDGLEIWHFPDHEKSRSSYIDMIYDAWVEDPTNARHILYYGRECVAKGENEEAVKFLKMFLNNPDAQHTGERSSTYRLLSVLEPDKELEHLKSAHKEDPTRREPIVSLAMYHFRKDEWAKSIKYLEQALRIKERPLDYTYGAYAWEWLPYNMIVVARHNKKLKKNSETYEEDKWKLNLGSYLSSNFFILDEEDKEAIVSEFK